MNFEQNKFIEKFGEEVGFISAYFVFTAILVLILNALGKLPLLWTHLHVAIVTLSITLIGYVIKKFIK